MDGVTVAIIEDDTSVREALASLLRHEGWLIAAYPSAEAFLSALDADGPPDCVLLDLILPGLNGVDVLVQLDGITVPTIALTAYPSSALASTARALGVETILVKPVDPEHLIATLKRATSASQRRR